MAFTEEVQPLTLIFLLLPNVILPISSCGVSTHVDIAHQAMQWFKDVRNNTDYRDILLKHQDAFIGGNPYPDAMYNSLCFGGKFHSISEDTHWAPFLNVTVNYIRRKYPKPWNQETEKLVAFTLGFVSHQVADVTWHSLGINQGFLTTMGDLDFHGSFPAAHPVGDAGGDMIASFEGDTRPVPLGLQDWYIPSGDLEDIYMEYYGEKKITKKEIELCAGILLLAWSGEKIEGSKLFSFYAKTSPFLMEDLHTYFQGGISDMAAWSVLLWQETIDMLEHGTNSCYIPHSPLFINCNKSDHVSLTKAPRNRKLTNPGVVQIPGILDGKKTSDINIKQTERGSFFSLSESLKTQLYKRNQSRRSCGTHYNYPRVVKNTQDSAIHNAVRISEYSCSIPYAHLGWSLVYSNFGGGNLSLVIGAPGYGTPGNSQHGRVYLVTSSRDSGLPEEDLNLDSDASGVLDGMVENGRFGTALAVVDLNRDGVDDLAISAPSTGANNLQYTGTVYVFYGIPGKGLDFEPSIKIHGNGTYYNLGTSLLGADVDGDKYKDLIIGSPYAPEGGPQRGSVAVFLAKAFRKPGSDLLVHSADWLAVGEQNYSWFGYSMTVAHMNGHMLLLISAPTFRLCAIKNCKSYSKNDTQSVGRVYLFQFLPLKSPQPLVTITGSEPFMKLGASLAVGNPYGNTSEDDIVAISATTLSFKGHEFDPVKVPILFEQSGAIYLIKLSKLLQHGEDLSINSLKYSAVFEGDRSFARFGWRVDITDVDLDGQQDLIFSAPFRTQDITEVLRGAEEGTLFVFNGGSTFPSGNVTRGNCKKAEPCPCDKASWMVKSAEERSRLGAAFLAMPTPSSSVVNLVVSSPRSSCQAFHSGSIHVFFIPKKRPNTVQRLSERILKNYIL